MSWKKLFLIFISLIFIAIYIFSITFPDIASKFGGISVLSNFLIVLLTYFYVVVTGIMVREEIKHQEKERRPYVIADLKFIEHHVWFTMENIGKTPAHNVKVEIKPDIENINGEKVSENLIQKPFSFFPPNKKYRSYVNESFYILNEDNPKEYKILLKYRDRKTNNYEEEYIINTENQKNRSFLGEKDVDDIPNILEDINGSLKSLISIAKNKRK